MIAVVVVVQKDWSRGGRTGKRASVGRKGGFDGVACERRLPRICYGPIAIVSPIYEFHCDTAAQQFGWLHCLRGSCSIYVNAYTMCNCLLCLECQRERGRLRKVEERGRMVLYKWRLDVDYRLHSIGTYGNTVLALVQADSKIVITL